MGCNCTKLPDDEEEASGGVQSSANQNNTPVRASGSVGESPQKQPTQKLVLEVVEANEDDLVVGLHLSNSVY